MKFFPTCPAPCALHFCVVSKQAVTNLPALWFGPAGGSWPGLENLLQHWVRNPGKGLPTFSYCCGSLHEWKNPSHVRQGGGGAECDAALTARSGSPLAAPLAGIAE